MIQTCVCLMSGLEYKVSRSLHFEQTARDNGLEGFDVDVNISD